MNTQVLTLAALALILSGCGAGSGDGLDGSGQPIMENRPTDMTNSEEPDSEESDSEPPTNEVSLTQLQDTIFSPICAQCHTGNSAPQGLRLDSLENSFDHLVGIGSQEVPSLKRVAAGAPENSYLLHKIEGRTSIVGSRMPLGQPALSDNLIQDVRDWISAGARRANEDPNSTKFVSLNGKIRGNQFIAQLQANRKLDPASLAESDVSIEYIYDTHSTIESNTTFAFNEKGLTVTASSDIPSEKPKKIRVTLLSIADERGRYIDGDQDGFDGGVLNYVYINQ